MSDITVYQARKIITMDRNRPAATHVAVRDGRVLAVGDGDCAHPWGGGSADKRFADAVLMPGFVEGHAHLMAGAIWSCTYIGFHDRIDPTGEKWAGLTDISAVIERLKRIDARTPAGKPLVGWGFDPIFLPTERLTRHHLDAVSKDRPIVILHSNFHLMTVNSAALAVAGYTRDSNAEGLMRDDSGEPNGELREMAVMFPVMRRLKVNFIDMARGPTALKDFARTAMHVGVTTATDLFAELPEEDLARMLDETSAHDFELRIVPAYNAVMDTPENVAARAVSLRKRSTDKLRLGAVKLMTDGSIQGYSARLKWPGYIGGQPNGIWNMPPEQTHKVVEAMHQAGVQMHIHTNGDEASEVAIDAIEAALRRQPDPDHRHTLQHGQMIGEAQFRRMARLGICVNLFANHMHFFGDQHHDLTVGPDRAHRLNALRSALDLGVNATIHSDAPVTPMGPLFTAWCAVNRLTPNGRVLGPDQRVGVDEALRAITLGAAYTLKLDHEIGSIEIGKRADFAILEDDPQTVAPDALKDVAVLGTALGGRIFER